VKRAVLLAAAVAGLAAFLAVRLVRGFQPDTDILALLPAENRDPLLARATEIFLRRSGGSLIFLVEADDPAPAVDALTESMKSSSLFKSVWKEGDPAKEAAFRDFYFPARAAMLSAGDRDALRGPDPAKRLLDRVAERLYGPLAVLAGDKLAEDPLLLFPSLASTWLDLVDGAGDPRRALVFAELAGDAFDARVQDQAVAWMRDAGIRLAALKPKATLSWTGLLPFAHAERTRIQRETGWLSAGSVFGIAFLMLLVFRSPKPLLLGFLSVGAGLLAGTAVTLAALGRVHAVTFAFGSSLIGSAVDYAMYWLAHRRLAPTEETGEGISARIGVALTLSAATTALSYVALGFTPLPGLRQMAVFSSVGLMTALAAVLWWFPFFLRRTPGGSLSPRWLAPMEALRRFWSDRRRAAVAAALCAVLGLAGLSRIRFDDNPRRFNHPPQARLDEDARVRKASGGLDPSKFVFLQASTEEELLRLQESAQDRLSVLKSSGALDGFRCLAPFLPSAARAAENRKLLSQALGSDPKTVARRLTELGLPAGGAALQALAPDAGRPFTVESWLSTSVSEGLRALWIGGTPDGFGAFVFLEGVHDADALRRGMEDLPGARYHDRVSEYRDLFARYRRIASGLLAVAYAAIFLLLAGRYGLRGGMAVVLPVLLAALVTFGLLSAVGVPFNLMHVLGLVLVLGMSADYAIFYVESARHPEAFPAAGLGIALSVASTMLSFGLSGLSGTPLLQSLGMVVALGMLFALVFSPAPLAFLEERRG
jgi:predicted exporter